ncbi:MAG: aldolase/citrate lyase family protein [Legionellaceae bacterium]|nr:aldolase/citrate lyase family protein [Legionellaceae bacterium]
MKRITHINHIRTSLKSGGTTVGSWIQIPHASVAEIMGNAGYDWVAVDMEHGSISHHQLPDIFRALELGDTLPMARLAEGSPKECKQALDAGSGGIIVPMIESAEQLQAVRDACRWPSAGTRGVGFSRANLFGQDFKAYQEEAQAPLLVAMIEHVRAVENLSSILAVDGLDAIMIGPYDLSASLGLTAQFEHANFKAAMQQICEHAKQANIPVGVHVVQPSNDELEQRITEGYRFIAFSIDAVILHENAQNPVKKL